MEIVENRELLEIYLIKLLLIVRVKLVELNIMLLVLPDGSSYFFTTKYRLVVCIESGKTVPLCHEVGVAFV